MKARFIFLLVFFVVGIFISYQYLKPQHAKELPIINPVDITEKGVVDSALLRKGYGHKIGAFSFPNQDGKTITQDNVKGKIYVVEYFFTTCSTICPAMNKQMQKVQKAYANDPQFKILSFTVDPDIDTVAQMKRYAKKQGANPDQWWFLTGEKENLYHLARTSFFVLKPTEVPKTGDGDSDFIHTNQFVLIDQKGRIRGYYDGTSAKEVETLISDIAILKTEKQ
jgi:protein SCO1/2